MKCKVESFIYEFNHLSKTGFHTDLQFKYNAGEHLITCKKHVFPSTMRRRIRGENTRIENVSTGNNVDDTSDIILIKVIQDAIYAGDKTVKSI